MRSLCGEEISAEARHASECVGLFSALRTPFLFVAETEKFVCVREILTPTQTRTIKLHRMIFVVVGV